MSAIVRRDPRREWVARNRLHPEHAMVCLEQHADPVQWIGPAGVVRRNPHAIGFIGPNGIRRIDRSGAQSAASVRSTPSSAGAQSARRRVVIDAPAFLVAIVADSPGGRLSAHDGDLLGLARQLADADPSRPGAVLLVLFGEPREEALGDAGADRVLVFNDESVLGYAPEARVASMLAVERELAPRHWLFPDSALGGAELGRRLAARLGERPAAQLWRVAEGRCTGRGAAGATDISRALPRIVLALPECAEPVLETTHAAQPIALGAAVPRAVGGVNDLGAVAVDPSGVALGEAEFILSGGNGIHDWAMFHHAAKTLGATEGASRVAVDNGFMPRDRQVGATGTWVTARVYIAAGISGAVQHLQGIQQCDKVIAVNLDPGCDMVKRADLTVVADSNEVLAALVGLVEQTRGALRDAA